VVWNVGPGTALNASWSDELPAGVSWSVELLNPDGDDACASSIDSEGNQSASCDFGDLAPSSMGDGKMIVITGMTDREDCGELENTAFAFADNDDTVQASASITVKCPLVSIEKVNDQPNPVLPGTVVSYSLTVTVSDGPAKGVVVTDVLPLGLDAPTSISDGGLYDGGTRTITWNLGDLDNGSYELTYQAAVSLDAEHGDVLTNVAVVTSPNTQCPDAENVADECDDTSDVTVRVPSLVIDKEADAEVVHFVFDAEGNVLSVDPEEVTWTLTYTLTNGPVTNAVITDPVPDFLTFVSASDGGIYDDATRTITWEFPELTASGSVTFVTTVDADAPETEPIVNVASIVSDQTPEDDGEDEIRVTSESEQGGNPTPTPSVPDTALVLSPDGTPLSIPVELMMVLFLGSLGTLAFANVRAARRRR
jgi:fimbrial isopeptide formation D2 family protein